MEGLDDCAQNARATARWQEPFSLHGHPMMARIRTIKPEFWKHEGLSALPEATHMLAAALLNYADDEGYFNANPRLIQAECCPLREPSVSIHESLTHLSNVGYLQLGSDPSGRRFGKIINFDEHQRVNRPSLSKIKHLKIAWGDSVKVHGTFTEASPPEGNREQGTGKGLSPDGDSSAPAPTKAQTARDMVETYHRICGDLLPRVLKLTDERKQHLLARLADLDQDLAKWELVCRRVRASPFLTGRCSQRNGADPFRADIDFIVTKSKFVRIIEGFYDERKPAGRESIEQWAARLAAEHAERHGYH